MLGPLLGQGGMGEVREAWDVVLCRTVALKVLRKMDPGSLIRFMHEARLQSRLVHPNICQIFDVDSSESAPRIAMQLVRGPTLADACGGLGVEEIVRLLAQVAEGVQAAHQLMLIHRDLKPSNILLDPNPEGGWTPYVCDFGLAMELGPRAGPGRARADRPAHRRVRPGRHPPLRAPWPAAPGSGCRKRALPATGAAPDGAQGPGLHRAQMHRSRPGAALPHGGRPGWRPVALPPRRTQ